MYNSYCPYMDWIELNLNQTLTSRQTLFNTVKSNRFHVGNNLLTSRLSILNQKIPLVDLNMPLASFKVKYKEILLSNPPLNQTSVTKILCHMNQKLQLIFISNILLYFIHIWLSVK